MTRCTLKDDEYALLGALGTTERMTTGCSSPRECELAGPFHLVLLRELELLCLFGHLGAWLGGARVAVAFLAVLPCSNSWLYSPRGFVSFAS